MDSSYLRPLRQDGIDLRLPSAQISPRIEVGIAA
jgi:hypothetical protein